MFNSYGNIIAKETKDIVLGFTGNHMALHQITGKTRCQNLVKFAQGLALVLLMS